MPFDHAAERRTAAAHLMRLADAGPGWRDYVVHRAAQMAKTTSMFSDFPERLAEHLAKQDQPQPKG